MAKKPRSGGSKTRLIPRLGVDAAAQLASCMIADTVEYLSRRKDCDVVIAVDNDDSVEWCRTTFPGIDLMVQRGRTLGERLDAVLGDLLERGFEQAFAIGADSPDLPSAHLTTAFDLLDDATSDVVFGPTDDGGYYLIGWKERWSRIVTDVEMSTPSVLADSRAIAALVGAHVVLATSWYDVDEAQDLERLTHHAPEAEMPATRAFLSSLPTP